MPSGVLLAVSEGSSNVHFVIFTYDMWKMYILNRGATSTVPVQIIRVPKLT